MTLPASGAINTGQIAAEPGLSSPVVFPSPITRELSQRFSGSIILPDHFHNKDSRAASFFEELYDEGDLDGQQDWRKRDNSHANVTATVESDNVPSGRKVRLAGGSTQAGSFIWDRPGSMGDVEFLLLYIPVSRISGDNRFGIQIRSSGSATNFSGYQFQLAEDINSFTLARFINGSITGLSEQSFSTSLGTAYFIRAQAVGTTLRGRVWAASGSEPETWLISVTDSNHSTGDVSIRNAGNSDAFYFAVRDENVPLPDWSL